MFLSIGWILQSDFPLSGSPLISHSTTRLCFLKKKKKKFILFLLLTLLLDLVIDYSGVKLK